MGRGGKSFSGWDRKNCPLSNLWGRGEGGGDVYWRERGSRMMKKGQKKKSSQVPAKRKKGGLLDSWGKESGGFVMQTARRK